MEGRPDDEKSKKGFLQIASNKKQTNPFLPPEHKCQKPPWHWAAMPESLGGRPRASNENYLKVRAKKKGVGFDDLECQINLG